MLKKRKKNNEDASWPESVVEQNEGEWTRKVEISSRKKSLAVGEACMAIFSLTPAFKGITSVLLVLNRSSLISASAVPHCGARDSLTIARVFVSKNN